MKLVSIKLASNCYVWVYYDALFYEADIQLLHQYVLWRSFPRRWRSTVTSESIITPVFKMLTFNCYVRVLHYYDARFHEVDV